AIQGPESADGSTITNTLQQIVGAIATAIATILLATGQSTVAGSSAVKFTNGTHYVFYFTLVLIVIGLLLSLTIKENQNSYIIILFINNTVAPSELLIIVIFIFSL